MDEIKRWACLLLAAVVALGGSVLHVLLTWPVHSRRNHNLPKEDAEWVMMATVMETCCVLFGLLYWSGRFWARVLRAPELSEEIRRRSRWHMGALHLMLGSMILLGRGAMMQRKSGTAFVNAAMIAVGTALMAAALAFFLRGPRNEARRP